jgi:hypothetical protein
LEDVGKEIITARIEEKEMVVTLKHVLQFITGAEDIPAIGFTPRPTIKFVHQTDGKPKRKLGSDYEAFSEDFTFCMLNSPGFGVL